MVKHDETSTVSSMAEVAAQAEVQKEEKEKAEMEEQFYEEIA